MIALGVWVHIIIKILIMGLHLAPNDGGLIQNAFHCTDTGAQAFCQQNRNRMLCFEDVTPTDHKLEIKVFPLVVETGKRLFINAAIEHNGKPGFLRTCANSLTMPV